MFKKIAVLTAPCALLLCLTACGPMSSKDACSSFNSIVSPVSGKSSSEDSKKVASQLEDLSDKAPDSLKEKITKTAEALRTSAEPAITPTVKNLNQIAAELYIREFKDVCVNKS